MRDVDGLPLEARSLAVRTVKAPAVVRFRPQADARETARDAAISVRFTEPMNRASTAKAFRVEVDGKAIKGTISWAESDTVLVFKPASALPYSTGVVAKVLYSARSATGTPLGGSVRAVFRTVDKPRPAPAPRPAATRTGGGGGGGGGAAVGGGSWGAVETYYLGLMNCTRTGGWVTSGGDCSSPGGRNVAALRLDSGISSQVARPYARLLATGGSCTHFIGGNPGNRLARAGYSELPLGREHRLSLGQRQRRRPRLAPLLPEREVVQRRPLRQPDEPGLRSGRDRRVGLVGPRPARGRLLPPLTARSGPTGPSAGWTSSPPASTIAT